MKFRFYCLFLALVLLYPAVSVEASPTFSSEQSVVVTEYEYVLSIEDKQEKVMAYEQFLTEYAYCVHETLFEDYFTLEEINKLYSTVETEVYQRDFDARANVCSVVFNRMADKRWSSELLKVCKKGQFASGRKIIDEKTKWACKYVYYFGDTAQGCVFFHSGKKTETFQAADWVFSDTAVHHFYK